MEEKVFEYISKLFAVYGWYALALIGATFLIMLPLNALIKKIFLKSKGNAITRIRKTLSALLVYVVAGGVVACANLIMKQALDIEFILITCVPVGGLAMVVWAAFKVVRDLGFGWLVDIIDKSSKIKDILKNLPIDNNVALSIYNTLVEKVKESKGDNAEIVEKKRKELINMTSSMLNGFVEAEKLSSTANEIVDTLKVKFNKGE